MLFTPAKLTALLFAALTLITNLSVSASESRVSSLSSLHAKQLLARTTFGHTEASIEQLQQLGFEGWLDEQLELPRGRRMLNRMIELALMAEPNASWFTEDGFTPPRGSSILTYQNSAWWELALTEPDQLRQRVAFALSQILVISTQAESFLRIRADSVAAWYDLLLDHAFGNYRELLSATSYSPAMGIFLSHHGNKRANPKKGSSPDENFARELMQLFSLGLYQLNERGEAVLDNEGQKIPTYTQRDVATLARVFTGWDIVDNARYGRRSRTDGSFITPMEHTEEHYDNGEKVLLGEVIPSGLPGEDAVEAALDIIFKQPSVAPFIAKQLIQRLVSSNPSPDYIERVSKVFNDNGDGTKGDLKATIRAILLDPEALSNQQAQQPVKFKEPVIVLSSLLRALNIQPALPFQYKDKGKLIGAYWFNKLKIGQNPLMARSVFGDFEPDFQPMHKGFSGSSTVAPESQIITSQNLSEMSNLIHWIMYVRANNFEPFRKEEQLARIKKNAWRSKANFLIEVDSLFNQLEQKIEGDQNGDFAKINRPESQNQRQEAVDQLINTLSEKILTHAISLDERKAISQILMKVTHSNTEREAIRVVFDAIRLFALLPSHWVQR